MCIAAAIGGAAVVGAYATDRASKRAADAAESGADAASATERYMYDTTREDQAPYRETGVSALNRLASMYGVAPPDTPATGTTATDPAGIIRTAGDVNDLTQSILGRDANADELRFYLGKDASYAYSKLRTGGEYRQLAASGQLPQGEVVRATRTEQPIRRSGGTTYGNETGQPVNDWSSFFDSPDYQFAFDEGNRAVNAGLAARGLSNSGAAMKELTRYGQGMASQQLGNYTNRLAALAGIGQTATQATGSAGMQAANGIGTAQMAAGDARASGYSDRASNINNLINQGSGLYMMSQLSQPPAVSPRPSYTNGAGYARVGGL